MHAYSETRPIVANDIYTQESVYKTEVSSTCEGSIPGSSMDAKFSC